MPSGNPDFIRSSVAFTLSATASALAPGCW